MAVTENGYMVKTIVSKTIIRVRIPVGAPIGPYRQRATLPLSTYRQKDSLALIRIHAFTR